MKTKFPRGSSALLLLGAVCAFGCERELARDDCPVHCMTEPYPHRIVPRGCLNSNECPSGTQCYRDFSKDETVFAAEFGPDCSAVERYHRSERESVCRLPPDEENHRFALINGFGVSQFEIEKSIIDGKASFHWQEPAGTVEVVCGLFACPPEFYGDVFDDLSWSFDSYIQTFDRCLMAGRVIRGPYSSFELGDPNLHQSIDQFVSVEYMRDHCEDKAEEILRLSDEWMITDLLAGCWAYDEYHLIGATQLVGIEPSETLQFRFSFIDSEDCSMSAGQEDAQASDGVNCYLRDDRVWGTCVNGQCRRRCITPGDCEETLNASMPDAGAADGGGSNGSSCEKLPERYVGICR